ncbi:hypothetical protein NIES2104_66950 [Leptolyngbya sp. NIES-2104]|nr:hypothetical protein NIES2104_66950 [Leptolyngbya sp. NIES-2104]
MPHRPTICPDQPTIRPDQPTIHFQKPYTVKLSAFYYNLINIDQFKANAKRLFENLARSGSPFF